MYPRILKVSDTCTLPRPTTTTNTQEIIDDGKDIQISVQPLVPGSSIGSAVVMGTLSGSSSIEKKVEVEDRATVHTSSSQPSMSLTSKGRMKSNSPTVATSPQSRTAPPLKIGSVGGFSSAVIGNAKGNAFSSLAGLHEDGKWIGNLESGTISRGQELWGGLTQLTSSSELGNIPISVGEKGNASKKLLHLLPFFVYIHQVHRVLCGSCEPNCLNASTVSALFEFCSFRGWLPQNEILPLQSYFILFYAISLSLTVVLFLSEIKGLIDPNEVITGEEDENCLLQVSCSCW